MSARDPIPVRVAHAVPLPCLSGRARSLVILAGETATEVAIPGVDPGDLEPRGIALRSGLQPFHVHGGRLWWRVCGTEPTRRWEPMPLRVALDALEAPGKHRQGHFMRPPFVVRDARGVVGGRYESLPDHPAPTRRPVLADLREEAQAHVRARLSRDLLHDGRNLYLSMPAPVFHHGPNGGLGLLADPADPFPGTRPDRHAEYRGFLGALGEPRQPIEAFERVCERLSEQLSGIEPDDGEVLAFANATPAALVAAIQRSATVCKGPPEERDAALAMAQGLVTHAIRGSIGMLDAAGAAEALPRIAEAAALLRDNARDARTGGRFRTMAAYARSIALPRMRERLAPVDPADAASLAALVPGR